MLAPVTKAKLQPSAAILVVGANTRWFRISTNPGMDTSRRAWPSRLLGPPYSAACVQALLNASVLASLSMYS